MSTGCMIIDRYLGYTKHNLKNILTLGAIIVKIIENRGGYER